jgi:hypothetical protein
VIGRAFVIVWPVGRAGGLPVPAALRKSAGALRDPAAPLRDPAAPLRDPVGLALLLPLPLAAAVVRRRRR